MSIEVQSVVALLIWKNRIQTERMYYSVRSKCIVLLSSLVSCILVGGLKKLIMK